MKSQLHKYSGVIWCTFYKSCDREINPCTKTDQSECNYPGKVSKDDLKVSAKLSCLTVGEFDNLPPARRRLETKKVSIDFYSLVYEGEKIRAFKENDLLYPQGSCRTGQCQRPSGCASYIAGDGKVNQLCKMPNGEGIEGFYSYMQLLTTTIKNIPASASDFTKPFKMLGIEGSAARAMAASKDATTGVYRWLTSSVGGAGPTGGVEVPSFGRLPPPPSPPPCTGQCTQFVNGASFGMDLCMQKSYRDPEVYCRPAQGSKCEAGMDPCFQPNSCRGKEDKKKGNSLKAQARAEKKCKKKARKKGGTGCEKPKTRKKCKKTCCKYEEKKG